MAVIKRVKKTATSGYMWKRMSSDVKKRPKREPCIFYTPMGRMVSYPAGRRPRNVHPEDWCALKTPFKGRVIRSY